MRLEDEAIPRLELELEDILSDYCDDMRRPQRPAHDHQDIYIQQRADTSIHRVTVPLLIVLGGAFALVVATYQVAENFSSIKDGIDRVDRKLDRVSDKTETRLKVLEDRVAHYWSIYDHEIFCARAETINKGWMCPKYARTKREAGEQANALERWKSFTMPAR